MPLIPDQPSAPTQAFPAPTGPAAPRGHFVPDPQPPGLASQLWSDYGKPGLGLAARVGLHGLMWPYDLTVGGGEALGGLLKRAGVPVGPTPPPLLDTNGQPLSQAMPSQGLINDVPGIQMDPNAGPAMRFADAALPMLLSGGRSKLARIAEAPGFVPKVVETGGHVLGAGADLGLQTLGGWAGEKLIGGPEGSFIGSLLGGTVRPAAQQGLAFTHRLAAGQNEPGQPTGGDVFHCNDEPARPECDANIWSGDK